VAALNIEGSTIHSFFKLPPTATEQTVKRGAKSFIGDPKFTELDALVIDEISMVRADLFDYINLYLQIVCETNEPFGGKQMILIGDLYQLPPVVSSTEKKFFEESYESPYFFSSKVVTS
jgi:superfamily I DNA and/or RNA helicase